MKDKLFALDCNIGCTGTLTVYDAETLDAIPTAKLLFIFIGEHENVNYEAAINKPTTQEDTAEALNFLVGKMSADYLACCQQERQYHEYLH